ncbi:MAG: hypothetical protein QNJ81_03200 [Acidimicrobiia bacterium]|nr:hypothetical protein [Acidimicrobiia bacterium]
MEETAVVGKLRIEIVARAPTRAEIIEREALDIRNVFGIENLINATAMLIQDMAFRLLWQESTSPAAAGVSRQQPASGRG